MGAAHLSSGGFLEGGQPSFGGQRPVSLLSSIPGSQTHNVFKNPFTNTSSELQLDRVPSFTSTGTKTKDTWVKLFPASLIFFGSLGSDLNLTKQIFTCLKDGAVIQLDILYDLEQDPDTSQPAK